MGMLRCTLLNSFFAWIVVKCGSAERKFHPEFAGMRVPSVIGKDGRINKVRHTKSHMDKIPTKKKKNKRVIVEVKLYELRARLVLFWPVRPPYLTALDLFCGVL